MQYFFIELLKLLRCLYISLTPLLLHTVAVSRFLCCLCNQHSSRGTCLHKSCAAMRADYIDVESRSIGRQIHSTKYVHVASLSNMLFPKSSSRNHTGWNSTLRGTQSNTQRKFRQQVEVKLFCKQPDAAPERILLVHLETSCDVQQKLYTVAVRHFRKATLGS